MYSCDKDSNPHYGLYQILGYRMKTYLSWASESRKDPSEPGFMTAADFLSLWKQLAMIFDVGRFILRDFPQA